MLDHVDVGVERLDRDRRRSSSAADAVRRVDHLALQVRLVDDVVVDDPDRADAGRGEVERRGRAEAAGAEQQHLGLEQLDLAVVSDLGKKRVARVAVRWSRVRAHLAITGRLGLDPAGDAALDRDDVLVAQRLQGVGGAAGAIVGAAVEDDPLRSRPARARRSARAARPAGRALPVEVGRVPLVGSRTSISAALPAAISRLSGSREISSIRSLICSIVSAVVAIAFLRMIRIPIGIRGTSESVAQPTGRARRPRPTESPA